MSTPIGHTLIGLALARRLGVRAPFGLAAAVVAASLPDADVIASVALTGDPWKLHRKGTHTLGFATVAGMLAGGAGMISAGSAEGDRDVVADAMTGALLVASHVALDHMWFPYLPMKKGGKARVVAGISAVNWLLDAVVYGAIAWRIWPRGGDEPGRERAPTIVE
ncbi:MAG: metal-dependent hydrolase [Dehalococcoidia bacterium]|nr:metal-dependent hydrolase [Dehalococcoidia bacterium]